MNDVKNKVDNWMADINVNSYSDISWYIQYDKIIVFSLDHHRKCKLSTAPFVVQELEQIIGPRIPTKFEQGHRGGFLRKSWRIK